MSPRPPFAPHFRFASPKRSSILGAAVTMMTLGASGGAQSTRYGDAVLRIQTNPVTGEKERTVLLTSRDGVLGLYVFCVDTRTPNVSLFLPDSTFQKWGYGVGARIPVTWRGDARGSVAEYWQVIGQGDDLRRDGKLGLITAELFKTQRQFTTQLFGKRYVFPAGGINTALRQLPCVVPFLRSTGYLK